MVSQLSMIGKLLVVVEHLRYIMGILIPGFCTARVALSDPHKESECGQDSRWLKYWTVLAALRLVETSLIGRLGWWLLMAS